jgi:hypothetical protein
MAELKFLTVNDVRERIKKGEKNFSKCKIIGADFSGMDLSNVNFESSELEWIRFANCKLVNTNFTGAKIDLSCFSNSDLTRAVFEKAKVYSSGFLTVTFDKTSFKNADIQYVLFAGTNLGAADFTGASKIRMLASFAELRQEDFDYILKSLGQINLPPTHRTFVLTLLDNVKSITQEKLMKFYDTGRKFVTTSMKNGYYPGSESTDVYLGKASTYGGKTEYREKKRKAVYK